MTEHTPGPWTRHGVTVTAEIDGKPRTVAWLGYAKNRGCSVTVAPEQAVENARLMTAAPDLLFACRNALAELIENGAGDTQTADFLWAAVKRATGCDDRRGLRLHLAHTAHQ